MQFNGVRLPLRRRRIGQSCGGGIENRRDATKRVVIDLAVAQFANFLRGDSGFLRELTVGDREAALSLADDISEVILERDHTVTVSVSSRRKSAKQRCAICPADCT